MTKPVAIVTRKWPEENEKRLKELFDVTLNECNIANNWVYNTHLLIESLP